MDFLFAAVVFGLLVLINVLIGRGSGSSKGKILEKLRNQWGKLPENRFTDFDFQRVSMFFREYGKKNAPYVIDDITWNDLEMDKFYTMINSTRTSMGDEVLYSLLRTPIYDKKSMEDRLRLIEYWDKNQGDRESVQMLLRLFGKHRDKGASALLGDTEYLKLRKGNWFKLLTFLPILSLPFIFVNIGFGLLMLTLSIGFNVLYHERAIKEIDSKVSVVTSAVAIIALGERIARLDIQGLPRETDYLREQLKNLREVAKKGSPSLFVNREVIDDPATLPKMVFLIDLWSYQSSVLLLKKKMNEFARLFEIIGLLDATLCLASYRQSLNQWCIPDIRWHGNDDMEAIRAVDVRHPMIKSCVGNPVSVKKPVLLTGSNASGKSTYLKTVAMGTLMAHTMGTCLADSWVSVPLFPVTSMALRDSILNGESYFVAEIKSLLRIFSSANSEIKCLCVVDEVLRGTNTIERIAASSRLLSSLAGKNVCILAATHDAELTDILEGQYENRHFEETITEHDVEFDYRIKEGRAMSRNAIKLLKLMGFDDALISDCNEAVTHFEATRHWDPVCAVQEKQGSGSDPSR